MTPQICPACAAQARHDEETWKLHPYRGHGYLKETGWTHPDLEREQPTSGQRFGEALKSVFFDATIARESH